MTVQTVHPALPVPIEGHAQGLTVLSDWLAAADSASALARQLVHSFFVPQAYKPAGPNGVEVAVANATGAILLGQSLGLDPLTSLQQIYVVHGRPGMYSKMKVALAQREGHRIWEEEYSPERSTWAGQRKGSEDIVRITLTIEDAKRAGWTSNAAYAKTPADMLAARCSARVVDRIAADALFGIRSIEDLDDEPAPAVTARVDTAAVLALPAPTPAAASSAARQDGPAAGGSGEAAPAAEVASSAVAKQDTGPADQPAESAAQRQWRRINDTFSRLGVTGPGQKDKRERAMSRITGVPFTKGSELTGEQAALILDTLNGCTGATLMELIAPEPLPVEADPVVEQAEAEAEATYIETAEPEQYAPAPAGAAPADDPWS
jgi:hypothetical protein